MNTRKVLQVITALYLFTVTSAYTQDTSVIKSLPPVTVKVTTRKIPNRIWKGFSTYFNDAENPRWYTVNKKYLAKFMIYDEENRALFSRKGNLIYHISYGYEKSLPENLILQVKGAYPEYEITRAIKISENNREIWVISLEDPRVYILVQLEDDEIAEIQKLKKIP